MREYCIWLSRVLRSKDWYLVFSSNLKRGLSEERLYSTMPPSTAYLSFSMWDLKTSPGIVKKTFGISDVIREALSPLAGEIEWAFIFGSVASGKETSSSDIDLMIIGEAGFSEVVTALYSVQESLSREINPKIFSKEEWIQKRDSNDAFINEVLNKPRMDVMGDGNELGKVNRD